MTCKDCTYFSIDNIELKDADNQYHTTGFYSCNFGNMPEWRASLKVCKSFKPKDDSWESVSK